MFRMEKGTDRICFRIHRRAGLRKTLNKSLLQADIPSGAKARVDFEALAARLKTCPFKTSTYSEVH
jgi:hypothetical protein